MSDDYYDLLGVPKSADEAALKSAYRKAAMQYHPDKNPGNAAAEAKFKAVNEAYDVLKDPQKRAAYDRFGKAAFEQGGMGGGNPFGGFGDIFGEVFEQFTGGGRQQQQRPQGPQKGADVRYDMEITLEEAFAGKTTEIKMEVAASCDPCSGTGAKPGTKPTTCGQCGGQGKVRVRQSVFIMERPCGNCRGTGQIIAQPCTTCRGVGQVEKTKRLSAYIPRGVDEGTRVRLKTEGGAGTRGGPPGDLYIFIHVRRHKIFQREGNVLFARVPISITKAALGGVIEVPGLDKQVHEIRIPAGLQSGKQLRHRGAGMPVLNSDPLVFGDMVVQIDVETPSKLSAKQRELLEAFRATETGAESPQSHGFFAKLKDFLG
jgi:molecular chaperone DnaJ